MPLWILFPQMTILLKGWLVLASRSYKVWWEEVQCFICFNLFCLWLFMTHLFQRMPLDKCYLFLTWSFLPCMNRWVHTLCMTGHWDIHWIINTMLCQHCLKGRVSASMLSWCWRDKDKKWGKSDKKQKPKGAVYILETGKVLLLG